MLSTMTAEHTGQLRFLAEQSSQVLQDFCKLATDYLQKGPNLKIYGAAANKLSVDPEFIRNCVQGLINLLLESSKRGLDAKDFQESVQSVGFNAEQSALLCKLYDQERPRIAQALSNIGLKLPQYRNIEWRFEVDMASRCLFERLTPLFAVDLTLDRGDKSEEPSHCVMHIDPTNLQHLVGELESAVQEARSQHTRKIKRTIKL